MSRNTYRIVIEKIDDDKYEVSALCQAVRRQQYLDENGQVVGTPEDVTVWRALDGADWADSVECCTAAQIGEAVMEYIADLGMMSGGSGFTVEVDAVP